MSTYAVLKKMREILALEGFPKLEIGVPESALRGPFPAWYVDIPNQDLSYADFRAADVTGSTAISALYVVVHEKNLPSVSEGMGQYLDEILVPSIVTQMCAASRQLSFPAKTSIVRTEVDWRRGNPVAAVKFTLEMRGYVQN